MQEHLRSSQGSVANKEALGDRQCGFIKGRSCLKYLVAFYGRVQHWWIGEELEVIRIQEVLSVLR